MRDVYEEMLNRHPDLKTYFPHYHEAYVPPREFFWAVLKALHEEDAQALIDGY